MIATRINPPAWACDDNADTLCEQIQWIWSERVWNCRRARDELKRSYKRTTEELLRRNCPGFAYHRISGSLHLNFRISEYQKEYQMLFILFRIGFFYYSPFKYFERKAAGRCSEKPGETQGRTLRDTVWLDFPARA